MIRKIRCDTARHISQLINAPGADFRRYQVDGIGSDDDILSIHLIDFCDGTGILVFTFHK